jgi:hypothetical protein
LWHAAGQDVDGARRQDGAAHVRDKYGNHGAYVHIQDASGRHSHNYPLERRYLSIFTAADAASVRSTLKPFA